MSTSHAADSALYAFAYVNEPRPDFSGLSDADLHASMAACERQLIRAESGKVAQLSNVERAAVASSIRHHVGRRMQWLNDEWRVRQWLRSDVAHVQLLLLFYVARQQAKQLIAMRDGVLCVHCGDVDCPCG